MTRAAFWPSKPGDSTELILNPGANGTGHDHAWRNFRGRFQGIEPRAVIASSRAPPPPNRAVEYLDPAPLISPAFYRIAAR